MEVNVGKYLEWVSASMRIRAVTGLGCRLLQKLDDRRTAPIITLFIPGTPLKTTQQQKRA